MNAATTSLRETYASAFEAVGTPEAMAFAAYLRRDDGTGIISCWGAIADQFDTTFRTETDRMAAWPVVRDVGDTRGILIFVHLCRAQTTVMTRVFGGVADLPRSVQRALVCLPELSSLVAANYAALCPAARQLWDAGAQAITRELAMVESRIAQLMSYQTFAPDTSRPGETTPAGGTP